MASILAIVRVKINKQIGRLLYLFRCQGGDRYIQNLVKKQGIEMLDSTKSKK